MQGRKRAALWAGLGAATALAIMTVGVGHGRAQATDNAATGVTEARALVAALEAQVRDAKDNLKKAKELLARLESEGKAGAGKDADAGEDQTDLVEGVWRIAGINGNAGGAFQKPPYDEYKIMSAGHYLWLSFDPETGKVIRSGGGAYSIKGGKYTAHIEYSNSEDLQALVGQDYKGTFRLEGKTWYHHGTVPNGAVFDELWERVH